MRRRVEITYPGMKAAASIKGPRKAGQPIAARDHSRKPGTVNARRIRGAQRAAQARQQKRKDSR